MILQLVCKGAWRLYAACDGRGDCELVAFLSSARGDALADDKTRMLAALNRVAQTVSAPRDSEFSHIIDRKCDIWQFTKGGVRILWFYDRGRVMILSHGFLKKTQHTPSRELARAQKVQRAYIQARDTKNLRLLPIGGSDDEG